MFVDVESHTSLPFKKAVKEHTDVQSIQRQVLNPGFG
jgi:hypothetical protein